MSTSAAGLTDEGIESFVNFARREVPKYAGQEGALLAVHLEYEKYLFGEIDRLRAELAKHRELFEIVDQWSDVTFSDSIPKHLRSLYKDLTR